MKKKEFVNKQCDEIAKNLVSLVERSMAPRIQDVIVTLYFIPLRKPLLSCIQV